MKSSLKEPDLCSIMRTSTRVPRAGSLGWCLYLTLQMNGTISSSPNIYSDFLSPCLPSFWNDLLWFLPITVLYFKFHLSCQLLSDVFPNFFNSRAVIVYAKETFLITLNKVHNLKKMDPYELKKGDNYFYLSAKMRLTHGNSIRRINNLLHLILKICNS